MPLLNGVSATGVRPCTQILLPLITFTSFDKNILGYLYLPPV